MDVTINLGMWNHIFAVPCDVVDKYLKTAAHQQLKVLLWVLRHAGEPCSTEQIAQELRMHPIDVKDYIQFWVDEGLLSVRSGAYVPAQDTPEHTQSAQQKVQPMQQEEPDHEKKKPRPLSRPQRPDSAYVAQRLGESKELAFLMSEAQIILGRPLSNGDSGTLLLLHENDGLPVDVILMLLQFAVGEGKPAMRYIEKVAVSWASEEIDTIEKAEEKIRSIKKTKDAWGKVARTFGLQSPGSATQKQLECADRWINQWNYSEEMLRIAYETCVDTKGEYNLKYIDGIIKRWHTAGIFTPDDVSKAATGAARGKKKEAAKRKASYDLEELESMDMFDYDTGRSG